MMSRPIDPSYPMLDPVAALRAIDDVLSGDTIDRIYAAKQIARNALSHAEYLQKSAAIEASYGRSVAEIENWHALVAELKAVSQGSVVLAEAEYNDLMARLAEELSSARPA
jgi:hypothetical protein